MSTMHCLRSIVAGALLLLVAACGGPSFSDYTETTASLPPTTEYRLGPGDKLNILVFGQPDLSGIFTVDGTGNLGMPLLGQIPAKDQTLSEVGQAIRTKLADGYLRDPQVTVQLAEGRPVFVVGEVANPGPYPFVEGMTAITAVATAGGQSEDARTDHVMITRNTEAGPREFMAPLTAPLMPADIVRVPKTFF